MSNSVGRNEALKIVYEALNSPMSANKNRVVYSRDVIISAIQVIKDVIILENKNDKL